MAEDPSQRLRDQPFSVCPGLRAGDHAGRIHITVASALPSLRKTPGHSVLSFRRWWLSPATSSSGGMLNASQNGWYLVWNLKGHVTLKVTLTGGVNAVVSGLFFR